MTIDDETLMMIKSGDLPLKRLGPFALTAGPEIAEALEDSPYIERFFSGTDKMELYLVFASSRPRGPKFLSALHHRMEYSYGQENVNKVPTGWRAFFLPGTDRRFIRLDDPYSELAPLYGKNQQLPSSPKALRFCSEEHIEDAIWRLLRYYEESSSITETLLLPSLKKYGSFRRGVDFQHCMTRLYQLQYILNTSKVTRERMLERMSTLDENSLIRPVLYANGCDVSLKVKWFERLESNAFAVLGRIAQAVRSQDVIEFTEEEFRSVFDALEKVQGFPLSLQMTLENYLGKEDFCHRLLNFSNERIHDAKIWDLMANSNCDESGLRSKIEDYHAEYRFIHWCHISPKLFSLMSRVVLGSSA